MPRPHSPVWPLRMYELTRVRHGPCPPAGAASASRCAAVATLSRPPAAASAEALTAPALMRRPSSATALLKALRSASQLPRGASGASAAAPARHRPASALCISRARDALITNVLVSMPAHRAQANLVALQ